MALVPSVAQVFPSRICRLDQLDLFLSAPRLHFFLASDRGHHGTIPLEVDEAGCVVFGAESRDGVSFVLENALLDVAGHADVKDVALTRKNVDVINPGHRLRLRRALCGSL
jgi:hypothetical protein